MRLDFSSGYLNVPMRSSLTGGGNLVPNSGFEDKTDITSGTACTSTQPLAFQWTQSAVAACSSCRYFRETTTYGGSASLSFYTGSTDTGGTVKASIASAPFDVQPGTTYTGFVDLKSDAALTSVAVEIAFYAGDATDLSYSAGTSKTSIHSANPLNSSSWATYPNSTGTSITAPSGTPCPGTKSCTLARIFIQHYGNASNANAKLYVDNVKFGTNLTQSSTSPLSSSYVSSGDFGSNTGGGNYAFPVKLGVSYNKATMDNPSTTATLAVNGNVGIGTTGPDSKLHVVSGNIHISSGRLLAENGAGDNSYALWAQNTNSSSTGPVIIGNTTGTGNLLDLRKDNNTKLIVTNDGSVGIGTTGPGEKLNVFGNLRFSNDMSAAGGTSIDWKRGSDNWNPAKISGGWTGAGYNGYIAFFTNNGNSVGDISEKVRIIQNGNVGIGTTSPNSKLEVIGNFAVGDNSRGTGSSNVRIYANASGQGDNFTHFGYNTGSGAYSNYIRGATTYFDTTIQMQNAQIYWDSGNSRLVIRVQ